MQRGELSNRPAAICGVDYRVLLDIRFPYGWFLVKVPELLLSKHFEGMMREALPWRVGARGWLERNWERRFASVSVGVPLLAPAIDMILGDYIAEQYHFDTVQDFRQWVRITPQVYRVFTEDAALLGLDNITSRLSGWTEKA